MPRKRKINIQARLTSFLTLCAIFAGAWAIGMFDRFDYDADSIDVLFKITAVKPVKRNGEAYIDLDYQLEEDIGEWIKASTMAHGQMFITIGKGGEAVFRRFDDGEGVLANELVIKFRRNKESKLDILPRFIPYDPGMKDILPNAAYAIFTYNEFGVYKISGFADEDGDRIWPPS